MLLHVSGQSASEEIKLETVAGIMQILHSLLLRHSKKVHFIDRDNNTCSVAANFAMKVDGMITFISECVSTAAETWQGTRVTPKNNNVATRAFIITI